MVSRGARIARGVTAAAVSTFVAVFFHGLAGGPVPAFLGLVACLVFSALVSIPLAGVALSRVRLALAVGLSQFLFHFLFLMFAGVSNSAIGGGGHVHGASAVAAQLAALDPGAVHTHDGPMWLSHAAAAAVTFVVLRYGERALWLLAELARLTGVALGLGMSSAAHIGRLATTIAHTDEPPLASRILSSVVRYRGPPAAVAL
ncbi:MAG TPA: hypothetical protein PK781_12075 [Terrimesophilobacter sp.]|nr:hypothetical protein [Terrimesophilobacter sp.]HRQ01171.1 hypothetical protein [Terrimesophilobacter sp.]